MPASFQRHHVPNARAGNTLRSVATLERTDDASTAPRLRPLDEVARQLFHVLVFERERAEWIALERIEACGNQDEIGHKTGRRRVDRSEERADVFLRRK